MCSTVLAAQPEDAGTIFDAVYRAMGDGEAKLQFAGCEALYNVLNTCRTRAVFELCPLWSCVMKVRRGRK